MRPADWKESEAWIGEINVPPARIEIGTALAGALSGATGGGDPKSPNAGELSTWGWDAAGSIAENGRVKKIAVTDAVTIRRVANKNCGESLLKNNTLFPFGPSSLPTSQGTVAGSKLL